MAFHDTNKTGALVAAHHERRRGPAEIWIVGTGLVELVGSLMTAVFALVENFSLRISVFMTGVAFAILVVFGLILNKAVGTIRPIFSALARALTPRSPGVSPNRWRGCAW